VNNTRQSNPAALSELAWLTEVRESTQPLTEQFPIWVRYGLVASGPTIPHPERHPYCEFSSVQEGSVVGFVGRETAERHAVDYFLAGPGVAHWFQATKYPVRFAAIYFLPSVLIEMGPANDGIQILRRFTARQSLAERIVNPPPALARRFKAGFGDMIREFEKKEFGHEVRLRTLLMEMLVRLLRWEHESGRELEAIACQGGWSHVERALRFLREHYSEEIYARDVAAHAGVSESRLKALFQGVLGMPWSRYLQGYRIHRAAALLSEPGRGILEAALAVGFESLSHFNATFRSIMGVSPSVYSKRALGKAGIAQTPAEPGKEKRHR
jgi:AraC-like DNA-binding protein